VKDLHHPGFIEGQRDRFWTEVYALNNGLQNAAFILRLTFFELIGEAYGLRFQIV
jgi:hypothetical protein